jgi:hypothetical protein
VAGVHDAAEIERERLFTQADKVTDSVSATSRKC